MQEPNYPESYWVESAKRIESDNSIESQKIETVIVGAGITGITLAYLLVQEGVKVALIDADRIIHGTTGHTTAKITAQHGLIYDKMINQSGIEKASLYYKANNEALQFIADTIQKHEISCDFSRQDAYVYTNMDEYFDKIMLEHRAYEKLGITGDVVKELPISIDAKLGIMMKNQAQFHPVKYLNKLVEAFVSRGGILLENTPVADIENDEHPKVILKNGGQIEANKLVLATHYPFYDWPGLYFARLHAERSYVVAAKSTKPYAGGMYINAESPTRSIRYTPLNEGENLLLIGGETHKTGQGESTLSHYEKLVEFTKNNFGIEEISYRWSAQDLVTLDDIPYVGHITADEPNIYVATGYAKWGMTNGTAAARVIRDLILDKQNDFVDLYTPSRFDANPSIKNVIVQNADVAKQLIKGKLEAPDKTIEDIANSEGAAVMINGERAGCYKDEEGQIYLVDTTCTHIGCEVKWNSGDRSWDCPCHGSRFSYKGEVMEGPATEPLRRIDLD
ncbi:FAD-dependent oxidoreductase [Bacillus massiliigorillae]|uniref:FAD-dependent oxidoreductase n=1 Tax=Bacillus massiliigorillae TaxID=1243664 RepID=UPI00039B3F5D|nr:FAD-dependent oxidoreductase [Bacillus massiliigorillae]